MKAKWGTSEHTADLGLWLEADSLPGLFEAAPKALAALMAPPKGRGPQPSRWREVGLEGADQVDLLVRLLGETLYIFDAEGLVVVDARISELGHNSLGAELGLVSFDEALFKIGEPVKAVTYHQAGIERGPGGRWRAQVVLDV